MITKTFLIKCLDIKDLFDQFDQDGNGTINSKELGTVLKSLNVPTDEKSVRAMFHEIDGDGMSYLLLIYTL